MHLWFNRQGHPINDVLEWARLYEDNEYRLMERTVVGPYLVSTVWDGTDSSFGDNSAPIIFETMVFSKDEFEDPEHFSLSDIDGRRYATEDEAVTGHRELVELIQATMIEDLLEEEDDVDV